MFADFDRTLFRLSVAGTLYGFALCAGPKARAAPITFNTALPISAGEVILREQFVFAGASSEDVDIDSFTALTVGGYGITPKWSVFGVLPVTHIETEFEENITWQDDARFGGILAPETSGTEFSLSPGAQYATQRRILDLAVTIPVADSFSNDRVRPDYSVLTSLRVNF